MYEIEILIDMLKAGADLIAVDLRNTGVTSLNYLPTEYIEKLRVLATAMKEVIETPPTIETPSTTK